MAYQSFSDLAESAQRVRTARHAAMIADQEQAVRNAEEARTASDWGRYQPAMDRAYAHLNGAATGNLPPPVAAVTAPYQPDEAIPVQGDRQARRV